ncbi:erythromycin esterase family protein [Haloarchaeobius sp. HRN-SO-5]|uniref:erythromycin esterase family protein n=1 Tax=Haloarchaeobius sp. HRN-SO-5 TaxID=3446118 RepID=UPI003EC0E6E0
MSQRDSTERERTTGGGANRRVEPSEADPTRPGAADQRLTGDRTVNASRATPRTEDADDAAAEAADVATPITNSTLDMLADRIGDSDHVLLGEATHGTSQFYQLRAQLSAKLVQDHGFSFVAVEGDWTDCYQVNRYVTGERDGLDAVLESFDRWPRWMWANWEVRRFADWLRDYNADRYDPIGFYGMDVYSLFESMAAVVDYLESVDPEAAARARDAYHCFSPYGENAREYARSTRFTPDSCRDEVLQILTDLRARATDYGAVDGESFFAAEINALVAKNAEEYYRAMVDADVESWNVRDEHMTETIDLLAEHHDGGKAIVWAHNSHVGDARATDMVDHGRVNLGQLLRERHDDVSIVGFGTHHGSVVAGSEWGAPHESMRVPPAREGSYGDVFHRADLGDSLLFADDVPADGPLAGPRGQRAIGVVYHPDRDWGNYVPTTLPSRYDAFLHVDESSSLHPLGDSDGSAVSPEAYPWGL